MRIAKLPWSKPQVNIVVSSISSAVFESQAFDMLVDAQLPSSVAGGTDYLKGVLAMVWNDGNWSTVWK